MVSLIVLVLTGLLALATLAEAAGPYHYQTVDAPCPGCTHTMVTDLTVEGDILGIYTDAALHTHGFVWTHQGDLTTLLLVEPQAVNSAGAIAGWFKSFGQRVGFVFHDGTLRRIDGIGIPGHDYATDLTVQDLNDTGQVVGTFRSPVDRQDHGFLYDLATNAYTVIDVPGGFMTGLRRIDTQGRILGITHDFHGTSRGFRWVQGVITFPEIPERPGAVLTAWTASGLLAGNWGGQGFVFDGTRLEVLAVPNAQSTTLQGLREDGTAYGQYRDATGGTHGFLALPAGTRLKTKPAAKLR